MPLPFLAARKQQQQRDERVPSISVHQPTDTEVNASGKASGGGGGMASAFVNKSRRVRFELVLRIIDLNNVPLVSGTSFIKWHLPSSTAAEHRGRTNKCPIRDHRVAYEYEKRLPVRLTVGKDGMLQECSVHFEIQQEYSASGRGERIKLGDVRLNLAEYVESSDFVPTSPGAGPGGEPVSSEEGVVRRYLMQDSKINSTLKVGIQMRHMEGTKDYSAPALRTAPVFGGIAGIIHSSEPAAPAQSGEEAGAGQESLPNLSSHNKEVGEMQDMYRRTLAAFWASQPGELLADECIEDIFAGGDGWGGKKGGVSGGDDGKQRKDRDGGTRDRQESYAGGSGASTPNHEAMDVTGRGEGRMVASGRGMMAVGGRQRQLGKGQRGMRRGQGEVDESEVCDDLRSWRIGQATAAT